MIQAFHREGYSLAYDPATDTARLTFGDLLVARWEGAVAFVEHGGGWFEIQECARRREDRPSRALHRLRALLGKADDAFSRLERLTALKDWQSWDRLMKHGIWKCKDSRCDMCKAA